MELRLQKCSFSDLEVLLQISKETFIDTFEKDNNPDDFQAYLDSAFTPQAFKAQLSNPASQFYFVYDEKTLVGYLKLNKTPAQTEVNDGNSIELERIYVLKQYQGKRIGQWMLKKAIQLSQQQKGIRYIWLGVWEHNTKAIQFYQKNGFQKFGQHSFFIGKDEQMDWLMRLDFQ